MREASKDQHAVAVTVEPVLFADGLPVGLHHQVAVCEGADQHEEGAFRKVEVGEEGVDDLKFVGRIDEDVGVPLASGDRAAAAEVFKDAGNGGPHRDDPAGPRDSFRGGGSQLVGFIVHPVLGGIIDLHRAEGAGSDMESQEGMGKGVDQVRGEVEPGGGGCHRAVLPGIDGLVALGIRGFLPAFHIGGKSKLPVSTFIDGLVPGDEPVAELVDPGHGAGAAADLHGPSDLHALSRAHQTAPVEGVGIVHP